MNKPTSEHVIKVDSYNPSIDQFLTDSYNGLPILAQKGLHEHAFELLKKHIPLGGSVLELAAGTGAMSLRLFDNGYKVTSSDLSENNFRLHDKIPFQTADLNLNFSEILPDQQDAIMALEIIEHVENPRNLMRECKKLLKPGGFLLISTPNIENALSMAYYLRYGHACWFSESDYEEIGHINPINSWLMKKISIEAGFDLLYLGGYGDPMRQIKGWKKMQLLTHFIKLFASKNIIQKEILVALLQVPPVK